MDKRLYEYTDELGSFRVDNPETARGLYFPLANEAGLLSAITPDLKGDIKLDQHSFLTVPVSREDLHLNQAARNFWVNLKSSAGKKKSEEILWSVAGNSDWQKAGTHGEEESKLEAGLLWQKLTRANKKLGLEAQVLNFIPWGESPVEVMAVEVKNISKKEISITGTSAIPLYGRSADNLRDHRHVTSLLHRLYKDEFGIILEPTMSFNERGHAVNQTRYFVLGVDVKGGAPAGFFPTVDSFIGEDGNFEAPAALLKGREPFKTILPEHQGREAMGALQFKPVTLKPGGAARFLLLLGIDKEGREDLAGLVSRFNSPEKVSKKLEQTKAAWGERSSKLSFATGDKDFDRWMRWVAIQPALRQIFGCSFLPDFDYGRGGRGWRDLWQDCLALLLINPAEVREDLVNNFGGVRIDGSNATVIGRKTVSTAQGEKWAPEFIADRNRIVRTWMDHGLWPFLTAKLYIDQTGDWDVLLDKVPFFRDAQRKRGRLFNPDWNEPLWKLKTKAGEVYLGTILEHILIQHLVQFFNVGEHNNIRLEDADWNDGLDMARERGESAAFTGFYAGNLAAIADLLDKISEKKGIKEVAIAEEVMSLLDTVSKKINYENPAEKTERLNQYFDATLDGVSGLRASLPARLLAQDLRAKAEWMKNHLRKNEWVEARGEGWFNGYYDNKGKRVEGESPEGKVRMTLTGQVFQIMFGVAEDKQAEKIIHAVEKHLFDPNLAGYRLNTDFGSIQPDLGRAFSFSYGDKENGAVFSHMAVMYANALYRRGFVQEGFKVLNSLYLLANDSGRSKIYPGLPEYFNNEGRGMYHYLTGSASWYALTLLTQAFGVRGEGGDLVLAPKLMPEQFDEKGLARVKTKFAGADLEVTFRNPKKLSFGSYAIKEVRNKEEIVPFTRRSPGEVLIQRELIKQRNSWQIEVFLD